MVFGVFAAVGGVACASICLGGVFTLAGAAATGAGLVAIGVVGKVAKVLGFLAGRNHVQ